MSSSSSKKLSSASSARRVLVAPAVHAHWERDGRHRFELGFLVGQSALLEGGDDRVLAAVEVPSEAPDLDHDVEVVQSFEDLSVEWVAEIAKQLDRMLPGGIEILGLYVVAVADARSATDQAALYLRAIASALVLPAALESSDKQPAPEHHCIVHIGSKTSVKTATSFANVRDVPRTTSAVAQLTSPCGDERLAMKQFRAGVAVDETIAFSPVPAHLNSRQHDALEEIADSRLDKLKQQLAPLVQRVWQARGVVSTDSRMDLLTPASSSAVLASDISAPERETARLRGTFQCVAFVPASEPRAMELATFYLKRDFARSLLARVDLLQERCADDAAAGDAFVLRDGGLLRLPARALMHWRSGATASSDLVKLSLLVLALDDEATVVQDALEILSAGDELPGLDIDKAVESLEWLESDAQGESLATASVPGVSIAPSAAAQPTNVASVATGALSSNALLFLVLPIALLLLAFVYNRNFH